MGSSRSRIRTRRPLAAGVFMTLAFLAAVSPACLRAQIQEEDLPPQSFTTLTYERISLDELRQRLEQASEIFLTSPDPAAALGPLGELADILAQRLEAGREARAQQEGAQPAGPPQDAAAERRLLAETLDMRARVNFNLPDDAAVDADLRRLLAVDPSYRMDPAVVSPKLISRLDRLRDELVGTLELTAAPEDATVLVDGRPVEKGSVPVLAGRRLLRVERPGFAAQERSLDVRAGRKLPVDVVLERDSAVLVVITRPAGARVEIDGQVLGKTGGSLPLDYPLSGEAARYPREELSAPLRIGSLTPGEHRLEVLLDGYRPYRAKVGLPELLDYETGVILLQATEGVVVLRNLPADAEVQVNERPVQIRASGSEAGRLRLPPGSYRLGIRHGTQGVFETAFDLADQQVHEVEVRLRPGLALLGVLGGDQVAAGKLLQAMEQYCAELEGWACLDRTEKGPEVLEDAGIDARRLRRASDETRPTGEPVDWPKVQRAVDRETPGAVYLLAVLSDDLVASHADLWMWPSAPGPARPDRQRVALGDPQALGRVIQAFGKPVNVRRPWLGAQLIDSLAAQGPVIIDLDPKGPAARAGLQLGDQLLSVLGQKVSSAAEAQRTLAELRPQSSVSMEVVSSGGNRTVDVSLGSSPAVVALGDPNRIYAAVASGINAARRDLGADIPQWLLDLNEAAVYLQGNAWEDAVRTLRRVQAPPGAGLSQAAVDYWLALALRAAGPNYLNQARDALRSAASVPGARLLHNDGPLVAPRARARLHELGE